MNPRIVIDRLDLDLRGIDPALAQAAVQRLAPALQAHLRSAAQPGVPAPAGRKAAVPAAAPAAPATPATAATPDALAAHLAQRIARRLPGG